MPGVEHIPALKRLEAGTLIDVGANRGQFSLAARHVFPDIEIHAFEPLAAERDVFRSVVGESAALYPVALGRAAGTSPFFVTSRRDSSSLFEPASANADTFGVTLAESTAIEVARLRDVINLTALRKPILLKLDVQGGELGVLEGAGDVLGLIDWIYTEASFVPFYERQPLAGDLISFLVQRGFMLRGVFNHSVEPGIGPAQADFLFENASCRDAAEPGGSAWPSGIPRHELPGVPCGRSTDTNAVDPA